MLNPKDPNTAIRQLAEAVDKLTGQVAAIMAYLAYIANVPVADQDARIIQGAAQKLSPEPLAGSGGAPALHASQGVERIQYLIKQIGATRSGQPDTSDKS